MSQLKITNAGTKTVTVSVLDAYTGKRETHSLRANAWFTDSMSLERFYGWYDLIVTVAEDASFKYRLAGRVENGRDSFSDPALGGLVTLHT